MNFQEAKIFIWITPILMFTLCFGIASVGHTAADTWARKGDMPTARLCPAVSAVNGKLYVIGGALRVEAGISTVEEYDPATDEWATKSDMPGPLMMLATGAIGGKVYALGGSEKAFPCNPASLAVMEYDTGFAPLNKSANISTKGKLSTLWALIKSQ